MTGTAIIHAFTILPVTGKVLIIVRSQLWVTVRSACIVKIYKATHTPTFIIRNTVTEVQSVDITIKTNISIKNHGIKVAINIIGVTFIALNLSIWIIIR